MRSKELVERLAHDKPFAPPLAGGELNERVVRRRGQLKRKHPVSDHLGRHTGSIGTGLSNVNTPNQHETPAMSLIYAESARQDTARDAYRRVVG